MVGFHSLSISAQLYVSLTPEAMTTETGGPGQVDTGMIHSTEM
jgi:hypothetical protein